MYDINFKVYIAPVCSDGTNLPRHIFDGGEITKLLENRLRRFISISIFGSGAVV